MATWDSSDGDIIRLEEFNTLVHNVQLRVSIMKKIVSQSSTGAAKVTYYQETARDINATRPLGRWEPFPSQEIQYTELNAYIEKYGHEARCSLEDLLMHNVPIHERMAIRLGHGVALGVDQRIWSMLAFGGASATASPTHGIRTIAAGSLNPAGTWDAVVLASRRPFEDLNLAIDQITSNDNQAYDPDTALINPYDWAQLMNNDTILANAARRGATGTGEIELVTGLTLMRSNVVTDDYALVCQKKVCATWVSPQGQQVAYKDEPGQGRVYRAWEFGQCIVTDPASICLVSNTQK